MSGKGRRRTEAMRLLGEFLQARADEPREGESRYAELFGTPERAARTMGLMCQGVDTCGTCPLFGAGLNHCKNDYADFASIAEWLRGDA